METNEGVARKQQKNNAKEKRLYQYATYNKHIYATACKMNQ